MKTCREVIDFCLQFPAVYEDYPFGDTVTVMRRRGSQKAFAFIIPHQGRLYLNLKCDPLEADLLRARYKGLIPAYHINKLHWNSIILGSDVPRAEIERQIENSYYLTRRKPL